MMTSYEISGALLINQKAAWELEELLVRMVVQDSLITAPGTPPTKVASAFQEEELEKAQLKRAMEESLLEARRVRREQIKVQQAVAVSLAESNSSRYRQRDRGHNEKLEVQQAIEASLRDTTNTRPHPRAGDRHKRVKSQHMPVTVESHTETTTVIEGSLNDTATRRRDRKRDRSKLEQLELQTATATSPREIANKRPRHTKDPLAKTNNTETRPRYNTAHNPAITRSYAQTAAPRTWQLPARPAPPRPRPEARVAVDGTGATGHPADRTRAVDPRLERTRPVCPRPARTDAASRPTGRTRTPDPRRDRTRNAGHIPDRTRPINRPVDRPRPVNDRPDRTPAAVRRPVDRSRHADYYLLNPAASRIVNRPGEVPRVAPNPVPQLRPQLRPDLAVPPVTASEIYRWLRKREGPRPVAKCFGACGNKLVFRGLQSDNGRREPSIILGCGHVVGSKCFSDLVDMAKASGEDVTCPHCRVVPITAAV
jgi:hypothetical protein